MNPKINKKPGLMQWVLLCVASLMMTGSAFGQFTVVNQGGQITINDNAPASPSPSTNLVAGTFGTLQKVTVTLTGISHGYPDDIDMLLEGPDGTRTMLMSDAGGQFDLENIAFTIDGAGSALPNEGVIGNGDVFAPRNYDGGDADTLAGGSQAGLAADLSLYSGKTGNAVNGTWRLFVADDTVVDSGLIRSWSLNLYMSPVLFVEAGPFTTKEDESKTVNLLVNDLDSPLSGLNLTATSSDESIIPSMANGGLTFGGNTSGTNRTLTIKPAANANGGPVTITITARDAQGNIYAGVNQQQITITVTPENDAPTMIVGTSTTSVPQAGLSTNIIIHLRDIDSAPAGVVLTATSSNPGVVPATNVLFRVIDSGGTAGTNRVVQIAANATTGTSRITIIATDTGGASSTATVDVTVTAVSTVVGANPAAIAIPSSGAATPYPSSITIANVPNLGLVGKAVVSLINVEHPNPSDIGALLVSPSGTKLVLTRGAGGNTPVGVGDGNDIRLSFDADAGTTISATPLNNSPYRSADLGTGDFPAPAPAGEYATSMASLQGGAANGVWSLYVYDTTTGSSGQIAGGWTLEIFPAPVINPIDTKNTPEDTPISVSFSAADFDGSVTNVVASVSPPGVAVSPANVGNVNGLTSGSFTFSPNLNVNGAFTVTLTATDNRNYVATRQFTLNVTPVNDVPEQSVIPKQIVRAGRLVGPVSFTVSDVETAAADLVVAATSNNPKLLPTGSIIIGGSGGTRTITLFPAGAQAGDADVTVTVTDAGDGVNGPQIGRQTFQLTVEEAANPLYENTAGITILDNAVASPYPSIIPVSGLTGTIAEVQVALYGITHPNPDDIDVMLVGPTGAAIVLMSDAGGIVNPLNNVTLRFRADGPVIPDGSQISSGEYTTSNFDGPGDFPVGGSPTPGGGGLETFNGLNPNGDWKLYVVDDRAGERGGVISSWQLSIRTRPVLAEIPTQTTPEDTNLRLNITAGDNQPGVNLTVTYTSVPVGGSPNVISSIETGAGVVIPPAGTQVPGGSQSLTIKLIADAHGTNQITLRFTDPNGAFAERSFNLVVTPVDDKPRFTGVANASTPAATPRTVNFNVVDPEGTAVTVTASSSRQDIVSDGNLVVTPSGGTGAARTLSITPVGVASGETTITLTATDNTGQKETATFVLNVTRNVSFLNTEPIAITDNSIGNPYPSIVEVSGVNGTISGVSLVLVGFTHPFPDDVDVLLVSPDGKAVMVMSDAGGGTPVSGARLTFLPAGGGITVLPDETALTSGVYSPANYSQAGETTEMPAPAPAPTGGTYSADLATFAGINPNGQWKLYVRDDTFPDGGTISGGWVLLLQTAPSISPIGTQVTMEDTVLNVPFVVSDQDSPLSELTILPITVDGSGEGFNNPGLIPVGNVTLTTNGASFPNVNYNLAILPATNRPPATTPETNRITIMARDAQNNTATRSFLVRVLPVDDPPEITGVLVTGGGTTNRVVTPEDTPITVQFQVKDVDSTIGTSTNIVVQSLNAPLIPNAAANIAIAGPNDQAPGTVFTVTVTLTPATNLFGTATMNLIVADRTQTSTNQFSVEVTPVNDLPVIAFTGTGMNNAVPVPGTNVIAGGTITGIPVSVTDVETPDENITLTAASSNQSLIPNSSIVLGGRGSARTVTLTTIGTVTVTTQVTITLTANDGTSGVTTRQFTVDVNPPPGRIFASTGGAINIPGSGSSGIAAPYPSTITVAGMLGNVHRVFVTINGLTHTAPDDIDILLVSPSGQKVVLMSDAGGRGAISNIPLTFDQSAGPLPDEGQITAGTYRPSNYEVGGDILDSFPSPAPAGPYGNSLFDFGGASPNGTWSLYIVDDATGDVGQAVSWSLSIITTPEITLTPGTLNAGGGTYKEFPEDATGASRNLQFTFRDMDIPANNLTVSYSFSDPALIDGVVPAVTIDNGFTPPAGNVTAALVPRTNAFGTNNVTIVVRRSDGAQAQRTVPLNITADNDDPIISRLTAQTTPADTDLTVPLLVTDVDTPLTRIWIRGTSGNTAVISHTNILIRGTTNLFKSPPANASSTHAFPAGTMDSWQGSIVLRPNTAAAGVATITIDVLEVDQNGNILRTVTSEFTLTVTPVNHAPTIAGLPSVVPIEAGRSTTNITFTIGDIDGDSPLVITATSDQQSLVRDQDIIVNTPSGPAGAREVRVITQPGVTGDALITLRVSDPGNARAVGQFVVRLTPTRELVFANRTLINIRDNNSADPYPSQINVSGFAGNVSKVTVTLNQFTHSFPDDVDILLVSPQGQKVILMSDSGGGTSVSGLTLKFDDTDGDSIVVPDNAPLESRVYKATNNEGSSTDDFANRTPAGPAGPYAATLNTFNGSSPNGTWSLYVIDDTASDAGRITNGWSIGITTLPVLTGLGDRTIDENTQARVPFTIAEESFVDPGTFTFTVHSSNPALVPSSVNNIVISGSGTNRTVTVIPAPNANNVTAGTNTVITITEQTTGVSGSFRLNVTPVNTPPVIPSVADQVVTAGAFVTVTGFNIVDVETARKDLIVGAESDNASVLPSENVVISGTDLRIFAGSRTGTARVTIRVTDTGDGTNPAQSAERSFTVTVTTGFNAVGSSPTGIVINDNARATPYPSTIELSGINGTVASVSVTLNGFSHTFPDDVDILLVGPNGQGVVLMSDAGSGGTPATALHNASLIFSDAASAGLPDNAAIEPFNAYKPTNHEASNSEFVAPAPAGPYVATLGGAFANINPNGAWRLYVQDDASPDSGSISGWILNIALNEVGPTITGLQDTTAAEDSFVQIPFTLGSATLDDVTFETEASNSNLVSSIKVGGSGADRTLQVTLVPDANGSSLITLKATDATGTRTRQVTLTVTPVNDLPEIGQIADVRIDSSRRTTVVLDVTDVDTPLNQLIFFASTAGVGLITDVLFDTSGSAVTAEIVPVAGASGTEVVTISVSDGFGQAVQSFNVTLIRPGPPVIGPIADVVAGLGQSVTVDLEVSDPDTALTDLVFFAATEGTGLVQDVRFVLQGGVVRMTIVPVAGQRGTDRITVSASDGTGVTERSFSFTVASPGPVLGPIANQTTPEDVAVTIPLAVSDDDTPLSGLTFTATSNNAGLVQGVTFVTVGNSVSATVNLVSNASGVANITISVTDGTATASQSFILTVTAVCEPPVIGAIPNQSTTGGSLTISIPVTDPDDDLTSLNYAASTAGSGKVTGVSFNATATGVAATFTLAAGASGTEEITVIVSDGCGSAQQTFTLTIGGAPGAAVLSSARSGNNFVITLTGVPGTSFVIESTVNFGGWTVVDTVTIGENGTAQVTVPIAGRNQYFRARQGTGALARARTALFIVGNTTLSAGDASVANGLTSLGFTVTTKSAPSAVTADATGHTLVVISSTVASGDVAAKFTGVPVPIVHWESAIQDDLLMTGNTDGTDRGISENETQLNIIRAGHPLAAGLSAGFNTVATSPTTFTWGVPQGGAIVIATLANDTNKAVIYGYEAGAALMGGSVAAARRVTLFIQDNGLVPLNATGVALCQAAVAWAISGDVTRPGDPIVIVTGVNDPGDTSTGTGAGQNPPPNEGVEHAIDNVGQKYLNFFDLNSGFIVTPSVGRTLVTGLRLWTANDAPERDPASYRLEGSVNGPNGPFTLISEGPLSLPSGRNAGGNVALTGANNQEVHFSNSTPYTSYRLIFPTLRDAAAANSMQIAEVEFFGFSQ